MKAMLLLALVAGGCATAPPVHVGFTAEEQAHLARIDGLRQEIVSGQPYLFCNEVLETGRVHRDLRGDVWVALNPPVDATPGTVASCTSFMRESSNWLSQLAVARTDIEAGRVTREADAQLAEAERRRAIGQAIGTALRETGDSIAGRDRVHLNCVQTGPTTSVCNGR